MAHTRKPRTTNEMLDRIAAEVGVSARTVQRTLNGEFRDTRPTLVRRAQQIHALARKYNYRPNAAARAMRAGRFDNVALILATGEHRSPLQEELLRGIHDALEETGQQLFVARYSDAALTDGDRVPRLLQELTCDGLLINYHSGAPAALEQLIEQYSLPAVWINVRRPHDCVHPDELGAGVAATEHLLQLGHRRIAYVDMAWHRSDRKRERHFSKEDRIAGYEQAMKRRRLRPQLILDEPGVLDDPAAYIQRLLDEPNPPTAAIAYGEREGHVVYRAAIRSGRRIPEDLSVVQFLGQTGTDIPSLRLTGVLIPNVEMGRLAVRMLLSKIDAPTVPQPATKPTGTTVAGYSTAPPPPSA
jgi:LacI family transcriptional regulator